MKHIDKYTMSEIIGHLAERVVEEYEISHTLAKKVVLDALSYNVVVNAVLEQVSYIMEVKVDL